MLIGTGCSVPGIMAARTIENERDRKLTIMLTPFIPCNAKLPVFALFAAAFSRAVLGRSFDVSLGYSDGCSFRYSVEKTKAFAGEPANFVMELPAYHWPRAKDILIHTWERARGFIVKAGTIIFLASGLVWLLQSFDFSFEMVDAQDSMMAVIGHYLAPVFAPLGFDSWQTAFAAITGFLAKEVVVSTFGILAGVAEATEEDPTLITTIQSMFTPASAYAFMILHCWHLRVLLLLARSGARWAAGIGLSLPSYIKQAWHIAWLC